MDMLTVREVAELKGCSHQYVKKIIAEGKLPAERILNGRNRPQYLIPLTALDAKLQKRYYQEHTAAPKMQELPVTRPLDHYSEECQRR